MERMMPKTSASKFYRELRVPHVAISAVIGKNGTNIQSLRNSPGISSVRLLSQSGKLDICGESEEAVHGVAWAIERRVCSIVAKDEGYHPDFFVYCFCKSLAQPLLAVDKICFQKFSEETSSETPKSYLCFKSGASVEEKAAVDGSTMKMRAKIGRMIKERHHYRSVVARDNICRFMMWCD